MYSTLLTNTTLDEVTRLLTEIKDPYDFEGDIIHLSLNVDKNGVTKETEINVTAANGSGSRTGFHIQGAMSLAILPIGESGNIEVRAWWLNQPSQGTLNGSSLSAESTGLWQERWALDYLSKVSAKLSHTWTNLQFISALEECTLVKLHIATDLASLENGLKEFSDAYSGKNVRYATFGRHTGWLFHRGEPVDRFGNKIDPERRCCWPIRLYLPVPKEGGVSEVSLEAEALKQLGKMPLLFSVTVRGCHYPESQALIDALLLYLRQVWDVEDVLSLNHTPLPSVASADSEMPITSASDNHSLAGARTEVLVDAAAPEQNTGTSGIEVDTRLLNATERVIVEMFNDGFTTGPIAAKTGITFHSVENYKTSIRKKYPGLLLTDKERRKRGIKRRKDWLD